MRGSLEERQEGKEEGVTGGKKGGEEVVVGSG